MKGKQLISIEEAVGKYRAVCELRDELDPDFIIMARTDARGAVGGSLEDSIRRAKAYQATGVDVIFAEALQSREEIRMFRDAIPDILLRANENACKPPLTRQEKNDLGICMTSIHAAHICSIAMYDFLIDFKKREEEAWNEFNQKSKTHPLSTKGLFELTGFPKVVELEEKFLPKEELQKYKEASLGLYDPHSGH